MSPPPRRPAAGGAEICTPGMSCSAERPAARGLLSRSWRVALDTPSREWVTGIRGKVPAGDVLAFVDVASSEPLIEHPLRLTLARRVPRGPWREAGGCLLRTGRGSHDKHDGRDHQDDEHGHHEAHPQPCALEGTGVSGRGRTAQMAIRSSTRYARARRYSDSECAGAGTPIRTLADPNRSRVTTCAIDGRWKTDRRIVLDSRVGIAMGPPRGSPSGHGPSPSTTGRVMITRL